MVAEDTNAGEYLVKDHIAWHATEIPLSEIKTVEEIEMGLSRTQESDTVEGRKEEER